MATAAEPNLTNREHPMKSSLTIRKTKTGMRVRATGSAANALFAAMTKPALDKQVDAWNAKVKVGDKVEYRSHPEAEPQIFTTRTEAEILSGHTVVVWLNGKAGCVDVDACKPVAD
jgi:hypothetical protein